MEISRLPQVEADRDRSKQWPRDQQRQAPPRRKPPREGATPAGAETPKAPEKAHRVDITA